MDDEPRFKVGDRVCAFQSGSLNSDFEGCTGTVVAPPSATGEWFPVKLDKVPKGYEDANGGTFTFMDANLMHLPDLTTPEKVEAYLNG